MRSLGLHIQKTIRGFPCEAFFFIFIALAVLSWTDQVQWFRLDIAPYYEHMIVYALIGCIVLAAKAEAQLGVIEISIIILSASSLEAIKVFIPFRHPKTSDFIADMIGFGLALTIGLGLGLISTTIKFAFQKLRRQLKGQ